jgi:hypothetical protein
VAFLTWYELQSSNLTAPKLITTSKAEFPTPAPGTLTSTIPTPKLPARSAAETGPEICGIGRVPASFDPSDINNYVAAKAQAAGDRWKAALLNSADLHARAVGLVLQSWGELANRESAVAAAEARDELVQLAAGGNDPMVYSLALGACRAHRATVRTVVGAETDTVTISSGEGDTSSSDIAANADITANPGACARLALSQWARLDPNNAAPWLAMAQEARDAGDATLEAADMAYAARAQKIETSGEVMFSLARPEMPQDLSPLEKYWTAIEFIGHEAASVTPFGELMHYCSTSAIQQENVRGQCDALATVLVNGGPTLLEFSIGQRLGARVGWSQQRLSELSDERGALIKLVPAEGPNPWSCQTLSRENTFFEKRMELGEMQALRYFKQKSP